MKPKILVIGGSGEYLSVADTVYMMEEYTIYNVTENTHCIHHFANSWTEYDSDGGPLHKLYYKITGKDWKFRKNRFDLYGDNKKNK